MVKIDEIICLLHVVVCCSRRSIQRCVVFWTELMCRYMCMRTIVHSMHGKLSGKADSFAPRDCRCGSATRPGQQTDYVYDNDKFIALFLFFRHLSLATPRNNKPRNLYSKLALTARQRVKSIGWLK